MQFQDRLYQLRKERGISQEELADVVGVSRQAVQKWESGASRPDMDNLVAISRYFDVTMDYLVTGMTEPEPAPASMPVYWPGWHYEFKSKATLFGLPLVHVNMGRWGVHWARGIFAVGNFATGVISLGGVSAGLLSLGCVSLGGLALGALSLGVAAFGGVAAGLLLAVGGLAFSFGLAAGGCAVGGAYAVGGAATATRVAAGGAASASIAIGDAVDGAVTFPKDLWNSGTGDAIRQAIMARFPGTPSWLVNLFSAWY